MHARFMHKVVHHSQVQLSLVPRSKKKTLPETLLVVSRSQASWISIKSFLSCSMVLCTSHADGVHQVELACLVPPSSGEKVPDDLTKYFLDAILEFMVLKVSCS